MCRPYFNHGTDQLKALFHENQQSAETLQVIATELRHRSRGNAIRLLSLVEDRLKQLQEDASAKEDSIVIESSPLDLNTFSETNSNEELPDVPSFEVAESKEKRTAINPEAERMSAILDYWRAVEMFNPQSAPKVDTHSSEIVYSVSPGQTMPWETDHPHRRCSRPEHCLWRYVIYAGLFPLQHISSELEKVFGCDPQASDERVDGTASVFSLSFTHRAEPLVDSFVLSSSAWALNRLQEPGPNTAHWLKGFESTESHIKEYIRSTFCPPKDEAVVSEETLPAIGREVKTEEIFQVLERILKFLNLKNPEFERRMIVRCVLVSFKKYKNVDDTDALNSFFIRDLEKVAQSVASGNGSSVIEAYLKGASVDRIDVRKQPPLKLCWEKLRPRSFPLAKWPAEGHHPLAYSQQIAVNELLSVLDDKGIFGINGPPGTGKTTLLRDIIAALVTKRAQALAELANPQLGFQGHHNWKTGTLQRRINVVRDSLCGFDMVVASSNNGAVENVTMELPTEKAVDPVWKKGSDYFSNFASVLVDSPAWALIAVRLGNKINRREFLSNFWFGKEVEDQDLFSLEEGKRPLRDGFQTYLKSREKLGIDWQSSVKAFKKVLDEEKLIREQRETAWAEVLKFSQLQKAENSKKQECSSLRKNLDDLKLKLSEASAYLQECYGILAKAREARTHHQAYKPNWWIVIWTLGKAYREWREPDMQYQNYISEAQSVAENSYRDQFQLQAQVNKADAALGLCNTELTELSIKLKESSQRIQAVKTELNSHFPYDDGWVKDETKRELSSPWMDQAWSLARAKVFLAALDLHKDFIHANAKEVRQNLDALSDVLGGNLPPKASVAAIKAAWDTLFLVTPVISTTFASFDRLLPFHGTESIGWLFIDEAGQATPQAAAGALWRARRAVVVGDPLQLSPILQLPFTAQNSLRRHYDVAEQWCPGSLSCQSLADQASSMGTWISTDDNPLWVGSPLRVHRRCDRLMFEASNRIAYDGLMIYGTENRQEIGVRPSFWFNVKPQDEAQSHWIPQEGLVVEELILELTAQGILAADIFLISPFRSVVAELRKIARRYPGIRAGTIHTVQGKESIIVILVLGGSPQKPGAKDWAAKKPNLVNVAVSRAKRRIYVIGDQEEWEKRRYFKTLSDILKDAAPFA